MGNVSSQADPRDQVLESRVGADAPIKFTYKADTSGDLQLGFIAEDVPELVSIPGRKGVAPMDLIAVLTKVVQTQQERIADLEERFQELEESSRRR